MTHIREPIRTDPAAYLGRPAERLVLEGYRGWTWRVALRSHDPWDEVGRLYRRDLGDSAQAALGALDDFARTLGTCASCPLRMRRCGSTSVCRDEVLILGLVAAIQHADQQTIELCLETVCNPATADRVAFAAGIYGLMLRSADRVLLPIPARVLDQIRTGAARRTLH